MLAQEPELDATRNVRENVEDGVRELRDLLDRFNAISTRFAEPDADFDALLAEQATVQEQIDRADAWSLDATLDRAMDALRLPDGDRDVTTLSGGERRRVASSRLLLAAPDLLLDEPTNHLDAESVAWLERFLEAYKGTVVAVTTIATSSTTSPAGSSSSTAGRGSPSRATTPPGWSRSRRGSPPRRRPSPPAVARSRASSNGCARARARHARRLV